MPPGEEEDDEEEDEAEPAAAPQPAVQQFTEAEWRLGWKPLQAQLQGRLAEVLDSAGEIRAGVSDVQLTTAAAYMKAASELHIEKAKTASAQACHALWQKIWDVSARRTKNAKEAQADTS